MKIKMVERTIHHHKNRHYASHKNIKCALLHHQKNDTLQEKCKSKNRNDPVNIFDSPWSQS